MANAKTDGNQGVQQQSTQPQNVPVKTTQPQPQPQRGEIVRRDPFQMLARDPFQLLMRDPFQLMREMMIDPFRLFQAAWPSGRDVTWTPSFEVRETDDAFVIKADMPGLRNEDIDITLSGNQLQISGKREQEQQQDEGRYYTYERSYGSFSRVFTLPESADVDSIRSELTDGVLTLWVPKKPGSSPQRRKIQISSGSKS